MTKIWTASSNDAYLTEAKAGSIKSFKEEPVGQLKWCISLNWPGAFLGTMPIGLIFIFGKGISLNGPLTRLALTSVFILPCTISGCSLHDFRFAADVAVLGPT